MTAPRQILPGRTYLLTRRTAQRQFLLKPSGEVRAVFSFCLAFAAFLFDVEIHTFCVLSNHFHLVVTDHTGSLPRFMHWLNVHVAKAMNLVLGRGENFWSDKKYSAVHLVTPEDVLDKIAYTIANPVSSWLVSRSERWPGPISLPQALAAEPVQAVRPEFFFREKGTCPAQVELELSKPPQFSSLSDAAYRRLVAERVAAREANLRAERQAAGKGFLGRKKLAAQRPADAPATTASGAAARRRITPRAACKDRWRRIERLQALVAFRQAYAAALAAWRSGVRSTVFPAGTYLMCVLHGARCLPP